jgi:hypothetical protein
MQIQFTGEHTFFKWRIILCTFNSSCAPFVNFCVNLSVYSIFCLCTSCALKCTSCVFLVHFRILCDYWCAIFCFCCALQNCMCFFCALFCFLLCTSEFYVIFAVHENVKVVTEHLLHLLHLSALESSPMVEDRQPVPKAYRKWCVTFRTTPSVRTGLPSVIQHSLSEHLKRLKLKIWSNIKNALCGKPDGSIIGLRVSKQVGMIFSSSPTCLCLVGVNPSIPTQFWCRSQKIWEKRISSLKSTGKWKSQIMDGVCWIMISNRHVTE